MINPLERAKLLKQLKDLSESKSNLTGIAKAKALKQIIETRSLLGFSNTVTEKQNPNAVYQAVLDGEKTLSIETIQEMLSEANEDPKHYQLVSATQKLLNDFNENSELTIFLKKIGFSKVTGLVGLYLNDIQVYTSGVNEDMYVVNIDGKEVLKSENISEIKDLVTKKLDEIKKSNDQSLDEIHSLIHKIIIEDNDLKYYQDEDMQGKNIILKDIISKYNIKFNDNFSFSDFRNMVDKSL